jgi:hypothetical protein
MLAYAKDGLLIELQRPERVWNREDLALSLLRTCRKSGVRPSKQEIREWARLLDVDRPLRTDASLTSGVEVREVALTCIEELTGEDFYGQVVSAGSTREILATVRGGEIERFHISKINEKDLPAIQKAIQAWLAHY